LGGRRIAKKEAAGDLARRRGILPVVDRQGEEVSLDTGLDFHASGGEHDRVAETHGAGAVRLLGQVSRFEDERALPDGDLFTLRHSRFRSFFLSLSYLLPTLGGRMRRRGEPHRSRVDLRETGEAGRFHRRRGGSGLLAEPEALDGGAIALE